MFFAERVKKLPPYIFAEMEKIVLQKKREGVNLISMSIGDPDLPPPQFILEALREESSDPRNHNYSSSQGEPELRAAISTWCKKRFKVDVDPETEVIALIGSKEGIANITRAFVNPGDRVLVPDPAYPVYAYGGTTLSEGISVSMPLLEGNGFKPDLEDLKTDVKMMFLNYPNNPTGATADRSFLRRVVEFAKEKDVILCYDNAYSEITFDGYTAPSILEVDGAVDVAIEFHSCSKTFNMTGDRIAFAVGNKDLVEGLRRVKSQIDSGPPVYIQRVAKRALESYVDKNPPQHLVKTNRIYRERRDVLVRGLNSMGFECKKPRATFYVWSNCRCDSIEFAVKLLNVGVVATPGVGFGNQGKTYMRFALTCGKEEIEKACERMAKIE
jgi:LL-diaminopimelate aminotransferase